MAQIEQFENMVIIAPSVLGADFANLADDIASAEKAGASYFHLDIMDGHFVPNISFGPGIVKTVNGLSDSFLDVHLMLAEPEKYFEPFVEAGADNITFHLEVHPDPVPLAKKLRLMGVKTGISINPDMEVERVLPFLENFDMLLIMSVYPGFGGQKFIPSAISKIETAKKYIKDSELNVSIEVDGGINSDNAGNLIAAGADILVMGTAFFKAEDRAGLISEILSDAKTKGDS